MHDNKHSRTDIARMVETVLSLIVMGFTRREICQYAAQKTDPPWGVSDRTVDRYIKRARRMIEKSAATVSDQELGLGIQRLEDLYKRAISIQDYKTALAVQKARHELLGLNKQNGQGPDGDGFKVELTLVGSKDDTDTEEMEDQ